VTSRPDASARPSATAFVFWGLLLATLAALQAAFGAGLLPVLVQAGAGTAGVAAGIAIRASRGRRPGARAIPDLSLASPLAALSVAAIVCGAAVGSWLIIGGTLGLGLALTGLVRERRGERRAARRDAR
jgi:hypothetical protein